MEIPESFAPRYTLDAVRFTIRGEERATLGCLGALIAVPALVGTAVAMLDSLAAASGLLLAAALCVPAAAVVFVQHLTQVNLVIGPETARFDLWIGPLRWRTRSLDLRDLATVSVGSAEMVHRRIVLTAGSGEELRFIADGHDPADVEKLAAFLETVVSQARRAPEREAARSPPPALLELLARRSRVSR